jgi:predicted deacylase
MRPSTATRRRAAAATCRSRSCRIPGWATLSRRAEELGVAFGSGYLVKTDKGMYVRDGIHVTSRPRGPACPRFTFEIGEGGRLEPDQVRSARAACATRFHHLKMLPGGRTAPADGAVSARVRRDARGAGRPADHRVASARRAPVRRGDVLARIHSVYGDELETFASPVGRYVRSIHHALGRWRRASGVVTVGVLE